MIYLNENDPVAAAWLREMMAQGLIPAGHVDERSIEDVRPIDLEGFTQHHFFAGIGGWVLGLALAGWPADRPVWTGSCPCQPFSSAGARRGTDDPRHLWPAWRWLIDQCRPAVVFGEQVASKAGRSWLAGVRADMEALGYGVGAADLCAAGVGAPHIRQRLWFGAQREWAPVIFTGDCDPDGDGWCLIGDIDPADCDCIGPTQDVVEYREVGGRLYGRLGDRDHTGLEGHAGDEHRARRQPVRPGGSATQAGGAGLPLGIRSAHGGWDAADWLLCRDGKWRPAKPGISLLADGVSARVGRLRGYGNAIVPQVAAEVIGAFMDVQGIKPEREAQA